MQVAFIAKLFVTPEKKDEFEAPQKMLSVLTQNYEADTVVCDCLRHLDEAVFETHQKGACHDDLVPPILEALTEEVDLEVFDLIE